MVYKRKTWTRRRPARRPIYRRPYRRTRTLAAKRGQNLSTSVQWFKKCGDIKAASPGGIIFDRITPNDVFPVPAFINVCRNWEQYKVLKVVAKYYPAYVGSESSTSAVAGYRRGNTVTYIDQPPLNVGTPNPGAITVIMGFPSAKLHQSRATVKRWMTRPRGAVTNEWSLISHPTALGPPTIDPDSWISEIRMFGDNYSTNPTTQKAYWFTEMWFRVVFRSKYRGGPPIPGQPPVP